MTHDIKFSEYDIDKGDVSTGEIIEELYHAKVVVIENRFYLEFQEQPQFDLNIIDTVKITDEDDGKHLLILENSSKRDKLIAGKAHAKIESAMRLKEEKNRSPQNGSSLLSDDCEINIEGMHEEILEYDGVTMMDYDQYALKNQKRLRVYGSHPCKECGQSFKNVARLERHLAVHQNHGSYICPLCDKTYKYEYNLFYHWRRTCHHMNELISYQERKMIEINALRQLVEEIAQKKAWIGSLELDDIPCGFARQQQFGLNQASQLTAENLFGENVDICTICDLTVYKRHLDRHLALHKGQHWMLGEPSVGGAYFCDLCAFMFRSSENLIKHWRTSCTVLLNNLHGKFDINTLDDVALKNMVYQCLRKENEQEDSIQPRVNSQSLISMDLPSTSTAIFQHLDENWAEDEGIIFAEEFLDAQEDGALMITDEGKLVTPMEQRELNTNGNHNASLIETNSSTTFHAVRNEVGELKWIQYSKSVQCNQCFRSFSSLQRLERHMAGHHFSIGTHHCLFCGSRFKYEYNLLFHYREVCPFALKLLSREKRQQLEAAELKKAIRQIMANTNIEDCLDTSPKEQSVHQQNNDTHETAATPNSIRASVVKAELGDSMIRRRMMNKIIQKHSSNQQLESSSSQTNICLPPVLLQQVSRPDLPNGNECPICSVVFYGLKILARHLKAAHPNSSQIWERNLNALSAESERQALGQEIHSNSANKKVDRRKRKRTGVRSQTRKNEECPP